MPELPRVHPVGSLAAAQTALYAVGMEAWIADRLLAWIADDRKSEFTLCSHGSGAVYLLRETRQTVVSPAPGTFPTLWGDIRFGAVTLVFREGERHMIEEMRTTLRPAGMAGCGWLDIGSRCCLRPDACEGRR